MTPYSKIVQCSLSKNSFCLIKHFLRRPAQRAAVFLSALLVAAACTKPEADVGIDLQDEDNLLSVEGLDTFSLRTYTLPEDSVRSDNLNPALVGFYGDPVFGLLKAGHVTELRLSTGNPVFVAPGTSRSDLVVDSLVLALSYQSNITGQDADAVYGNLGPQFFRVFEIIDSLEINTPYYHTTEFNFIEEDLVVPGRNMVTPKPFDTLTVGGMSALPEVRLPLNTEIAERILSVNDGNGITAAQFVSVFKGLYIAVDETMTDPFNAGILYFDTFTQLSRMSMFYRNTATGDTLRYEFVIRNNSGKFNVFEHARELAEQPLRQQVTDMDPEPGQRDLYVQAAGGTKLRIDLPHIDELKERGLAINKAVITLPLRGDGIGAYPPPDNLFIFGLSDEGNAFLLDDQIDGAGFIGGVWDPENGRYRFTVTRYLQQVLNGTRPFNGFEVVSSGAAFSAKRVVLNGPDYPDPATPENNAKLEIIFTNY